jgi:hypothetical protein
MDLHLWKARAKFLPHIPRSSDKIGRFSAPDKGRPSPVLDFAVSGFQSFLG